MAYMKLFSSLTQKSEDFRPLKQNEVTIYVCGITPEGPAHLGHAFVNVLFDALVRYLKYKGFNINYTQNVTDVDDDILRKAKQQNKDWQEFGDFWTKKYQADLQALNVLPPTHYVKATGSIKKMVEIVENLLQQNFAYINQGNIYFDVKKFKSYGKLSKYTQKQMGFLSKERGADPNDPRKKHPLDFILWQKSQPGEPSWETSFGSGRPGWHIECSAMINEFLGEQIDIHGGGRDLIYPHHESEIAQSESFTGKTPFVKYWMHIAMVLYEGEKMAKSLGNLVLISDLLKKYDANTIRWFLLAHHYRNPWEFEWQELEEAKEKVQSIANYLLDKDKSKHKSSVIAQFEQFMDDDLQTDEALKFVLELTGNPDNQASIRKILEVLGFIF